MIGESWEIIAPDSRAWLEIRRGLRQVAEVVGRDEEAWKIARLIAAAPDLLAACKAIYRWLGRPEPETPEQEEEDKRLVWDATEQLTYAIAKAKGEPHD